MKKIGIIADDLTGANDSGVQLKEKGIDTSVLFDNLKEGIKIDADLDDGLVINTNSRGLSVNKAEMRTYEAAKFLQDKDFSNIYKKMDSTLRGHIAEEIYQVYKVIKPDFVFIAPAYPALSRTTINGTHYLNNKKIEETDISKDPIHPVSESHIPTVIFETIKQKTGCLNLNEIRSGFMSFSEKVNKLRREGINFLVCDAENESDLKVAANYMSDFSSNVLWVGSAGLAEVLPAVLELSNDSHDQLNITTGPVLTVCGSLSNVTHNQIETATSKDGVVGLEVDSLKVFEEYWREYKRNVIREGRKLLDQGLDLIIYLPSNDKVREEAFFKGKESGLTHNQISNFISEGISSIACEILADREDVASLVLTGGDTAEDIVTKLGGIGIKLVKQIETGIPMGELIGSSKEYNVVTKAGAFGNANSIYNAMLELKGVL